MGTDGREVSRLRTLVTVASGAIVNQSGWGTVGMVPAGELTASAAD